MAITKISVNTPQKFLPTTQKNIPKYTTPFIGFVRDNVDSAKMNRIKVWIPELSSDNEDSWYTINWCSPFAGATEMNKTYSQTSFGLWFSPPAINNQVVVMFINGDPNMGVYVGGLYQQFMNNMTPGIPNSDLNTQTNGKPNNAPATEYNKTDKTVSSTSTDPVRPAFKPLSDALAKQGLSSDHIRGTSTSSGRRDSPSNVNGILTQGGNQLVMDDDEDNAFIRLRTKNGTQIMINDTVGNIYMCTRNGNSWMELSDSGIDVYTTRKISMRCAGDFNIHSDSNINMFAGKYINMTAASGFTLSTDQSINAVVGNQLNLQTEGAISIKSSADLNLIGNGNIGIDSGSTLAIRACESMGLTACGTIFQKGEYIKLNSGDGPTPSGGNDADVKDVSNVKDIEVNQSNGYNSLKTKSIVSRLPTHEPFSGHPYVSENADTISVNTSLQSRSQIGTSGTTAPATNLDTNNLSESNDSLMKNYSSSKNNSKVINSKIMPNGDIQTTYSDGSTSTDTYDSKTGTYYNDGDKTQPLSPAEVSIRKSVANNFSNNSASSNVVNNFSNNTKPINTVSSKGVDIFTSAKSKSKSSLLGLANVGLVAANVLSSMNTNSSIPSVQKTTTPKNADGESWLSPISGKIVTLYSEDNYGVMIKPISTQVIADKSGTIIWAGDGAVGSSYNGYTGCVVIDHGDGTQSLISNLTSISVKLNQQVNQKAGIGSASLGKNIHYEIRDNGIPIDPSNDNPKLGILNSNLDMGK